MSRLFWCWNFLHYSIFRFENNVSYFINSFVKWFFGLFFEIPIIKKGFEKRGFSKRQILGLSERSLNNSISGVNIIIAGVQMGGILIFIEYSIFNFVQVFLGRSLIQYVWENDLCKILFVLLFLIIPGVFNYLVLFKKDRYLLYFNEFNSYGKREITKYSWLSFGFIFLVIMLLISSFYF